MERAIGAKAQTTCQRCGTCCVNGGPALHTADLSLLHDRRLALSDLITIRLGEPVFSPLVNGIEPARTELIKISGRTDSWTCRFFDQAMSGCGIYDHRPVECRLLKCWETADLTRMIYQECLCRQDILPADEELRELIGIQEEHCGFAIITTLATGLAAGGGAAEITAEIARVVTLDLKIRQRAIRVRGLSVEEELLFFGRPLFKSLAYYQLACYEGPQGLTVHQLPSFGT